MSPFSRLPLKACQKVTSTLVLSAPTWAVPPPPLVPPPHANMTMPAARAANLLNLTLEPPFSCLSAPDARRSDAAHQLPLGEKEHDQKWHGGHQAAGCKQHRIRRLVVLEGGEADLDRPDRVACGDHQRPQERVPAQDEVEHGNRDQRRPGQRRRHREEVPKVTAAIEL